MRNHLKALATSLVTLILAAPAFPQFKPTVNVNCTRGESLAGAVALALPNTLINVKGTCAGPILITTAGLQINAVGAAGIAGGGKDAVTIAGARGIVLSGLTISGGANGLVANGGA